MSTPSTTTELPPPLAEMAERWLDQLVIQDLTRRAYRAELDRFLKWACAENISESKLDAYQFEQFAACLSSDRARELAIVDLERPLLSSSLEQARRILSAWLRWAAAREWVSSDLAVPAPWPKPDRTSTRSPPVSATRLKGLLVVSTPSTEHSACREKFVVGLSFWLGLSPTEIAALARDDVQVRGNHLEVGVASAAGDPEIRVGPMALRKLWLAYDRQRGASVSAVTSLQDSRHVTSHTVARIIRQAFDRPEYDADELVVNARGLRRSFVAHAAEHGWSSDDVKHHLRRRSLPGVKFPTPSRRDWNRKVDHLETKLNTSSDDPAA